MTGPSPPTKVEIRLSVPKTRHDYRISFAILISGVAITVGFYAHALGANSLGASPMTPLEQVTYTAVGRIGAILILVGAIFTGINGSLLRRTGRPLWARAG